MGRGRFGTDSPASPHPAGAGSAGQRPWRNTDFHSNEAFWHRLARLPSTFWGRLSRAEPLEEHGLPQQRGFWRRLARLPSPFWGRLSRAIPPPRRGAHHRPARSPSLGRGRVEQERVRMYPKDGELCLGRAKPGETLVEARSGPDVQIGRPTWA
ncbi:hypothetical protein ROHU_028385 [Labeo rohita]|uniref:Uncharacterized protein n=1 Tax=Labeo rohita TaxID=84645 RepID=A0A498M5A8_LABRO|nr:hypothetical protein ROHU_028385 [Labeo rohita]